MLQLLGEDALLKLVQLSLAFVHLRGLLGCLDPSFAVPLRHATTRYTSLELEIQYEGA